MMRRCAGTAGLILALATTAMAADRDFSLEAESLFSGTQSPSRIQPYLITVENRGRGTRGEVVVTTTDFTNRYPIDLPQGSRKQLIAYVPVSYMLHGDVFLRTPEGGARFKIEAPVTPMTRCMVGVTDATGELGFLRTSAGGQGEMADVYLDPDRMPDRAVAYAGVSGVFLGEGSERIGDAGLDALKRYVVAGGTVVLSGGASMPIQGDPRWQSMLPVVRVQPKTLRLNATIHGLPLLEATTFGIGSLAPGAKTTTAIAGVPLVVEKRYGLGRVVYLAMNLTEGPAKGWPNRRAFLSSTGVLNQESGFTNLFSYIAPQGYGYAYSGSTPVPPGGPPPGGYLGSTEEDPFSVEVPKTPTVLAILLAYLVLVVPVNLIALRKMGKGEWAWVTSPIISLAFAAIFFRYSAGLYTADLSSASRGILVVRQGEPEAFYVGRSQLFFPRGGAYDLKLDGVEAIFPNTASYSGPMASSSDLGTFDVGQIVAQPRVPNLAFREFSYAQQVSAGAWLDVKIVERGGKAVRATVTNRSPYKIAEGGVVLDKGSFDVGDLAPGAAKTVDAGDFAVADYAIDLANVEAARGIQGVFVGVIDFRPGPQIGSVVPQHHRNWLIYTFPRSPR